MPFFLSTFDIKDSRSFLGQTTFPLLLSTGWVQGTNSSKISQSKLYKLRIDIHDKLAPLLNSFKTKPDLEILIIKKSCLPYNRLGCLVNISNNNLVIKVVIYKLLVMEGGSTSITNCDVIVFQCQCPLHYKALCGHCQVTTSS